MGLGIEELLADKREEILRLAERHGARNVRIFGSVARGEAGPDSDVDVLVEFDPERTLIDAVGFKQDLEDTLGRPVHVVSEVALHQRLKERVLSEATRL